VLLPEGQTSGHLYVLKSGSIEVLRGEMQVAVVEEPGAVFGEMSVLLNRPHTATVRALTPIEVYARSIDKVLGPLYKGIDATAGMITFDDGTLYHLNMSWALPITWPPAVYSLAVGIIGTTGALTIDDTHSDIVLAVSKPQSEGYNPDATRLVDFMGSYPPGDMALGELRGPMALETDSWLNRVSLGLPTAAATVDEAHRNLMLTKALDLSAKRGVPVKLPLSPDDFEAAA